MVAFLTLAMMLVACQASPSTVVYVVVTPTPSPETPSPIPSASPVVTVSPTSRFTPSPQPTVTPDIFPTQTVQQIQVAEQVFEGGRMFWVGPQQQIWVAIVDGQGRGRWMRYEDTFVEGQDPENDPELTAPEGLIQPERGFGKLWRNNPEVRTALGWAITPEFGYISQYEYHPRGRVEDDMYIPDEGYHILFSLNGESFRFEEAADTWRLN
jgi:hypothetical protein